MVSIYSAIMNYDTYCINYLPSDSLIRYIGSVNNISTFKLPWCTNKNRSDFNRSKNHISSIFKYSTCASGNKNIRELPSNTFVLIAMNWNEYNCNQKLLCSARNTFSLSGFENLVDVFFGNGHWFVPDEAINVLWMVRQMAKWTGLTDTFQRLKTSTSTPIFPKWASHQTPVEPLQGSATLGFTRCHSDHVRSRGQRSEVTHRVLIGAGGV